jgi:molybdopterin-guanine dinucleotide biosynthesis protein A
VARSFPEPLDAAAIVLAGGSSSRMGRPKTSLPFGGESLLARVVRHLRPLVRETLLVTGPHVELPELPAGTRIVLDETPRLGPAAGILFGLRAARADLALVCAADHPFPSEPLARALLERIGSRPLLVPRWQGRLEPLFAAYRRTFAPWIERALASGRRRLLDLVEAAGEEAVFEEEEVRLFDAEGLSFVDVDTPEEYEAALGRLGRTG